jgi:hypothetical protein
MNHVENILSVYLLASDESVGEGMAWYNNAHNLALELSPNDVWRGAGVIAAYSPLTPWDRNVMLATESLKTGIAHPKSLGNSVRAAQRILDGEHTLEVLKGDKTRAFASAIADPAGSTIATIDRHAYDIAMGEYHTDDTRKIGKRVFRTLSDAYVEASFLADIGVAQMQAITWIAWRIRKGVV